MLLLGDVAEFKRGRGPDKRPRKRRREVGIAAATIGGGGVLGAGVGQRSAGKAYIGWMKAANQSFRKSYPRLSRIMTSKQIDRVIEANLGKLPVKERAARLSITAIKNPKRAGALAGAALGTGVYGIYRATKGREKR